MSVYGEGQYSLDQGYLLRDVRVRIPRAEGGSVDKAMLALVTSHGCDCDRYDRATSKGEAVENLVVQVAPVMSLGDLPDNGLHNDIRRGGVHRYFHMPEEEAQPEQVADLWYEQPVPTQDLMRLVRVATLSEEWCQRLAIQIFVLRSRKRVEDVFRDPGGET